MSILVTDLASKTSAAMAALISGLGSTALLDASVYVGQGAEDDLTLPRIECASEQGNQDVQGLGNFWMTCTIYVKSTTDPEVDIDGAETSDTKLTQHSARVAAIYNAVVTDGLDIDLNAAAATATIAWTCQAVMNFRWTEPMAQENHFVSEIGFEALCCNSTLG